MSNPSHNSQAFLSVQQEIEIPKMLVRSQFHILEDHCCPPCLESPSLAQPETGDSESAGSSSLQTGSRNSSVDFPVCRQAQPRTPCSKHSASLHFSEVPRELSMPCLSRSLDHSLRNLKHSCGRLLLLVPSQTQDTGGALLGAPIGRMQQSPQAGVPRANHLSPQARLRDQFQID